MEFRNGLILAVGVVFLSLGVADALRAPKPSWHSGWIFVAALLFNAGWLAYSASGAAAKFTWFSAYERGFWGCVLRDSLVAAQLGLILLAVSLVRAQGPGIVSITGEEECCAPWPLGLLYGKWAWIAALLIAGVVGNGLALADSRAQTHVPTINRQLEERAEQIRAAVPSANVPTVTLTPEQEAIAAKYRVGWTWINVATIVCFLVGVVWAFFGERLAGTWLDFDRGIGVGTVLTVVLVIVISAWKGVL